MRAHRTFSALLALLAIIQWAWLLEAVPELQGNDFGIFYRSAASAMPYAGHPGNPVMESGKLLTNLNPPHVLFVFAPFTLLPLWAACVLWWTLTGLLLVGGLTWWLRSQGECWTPNRILWALLWAPIVTMGFTGQVTAIVGVPLWLSYRALTRGQRMRGGLLAGVVLSIKPILWPLAVWYVVRRGWREVAGMVAGAATAVGLGLAFYGVETYHAWLAALARIPWVSVVMNASVSGLCSRLPIATPPGLWLVLGVALALWTVWRTRTRALDDAWMPLVAASLLASPLGWVYYGAWLLPGTRAEQWTKGVALGWCAPLLAVGGLGFVNPWFGATVGSCYGWTLLAIWFGAVRSDPARSMQDRMAA
jgi:hypothetical protein